MAGDARDLVDSYLRRPDDFWAKETRGWRQVEKLQTRLERLRARLGGGDADAVGEIWSTAVARAGRHGPTVYILGLGGSGSHWVANMLDDLGPFVSAQEVTFPRELVAAIDGLRPEDRAVTVDAVHLAHVLPSQRGVGRSSIVNPASGVASGRHKAWEPDCVVVYLVRDPRDQVMSLVHRKPRFRALVDPGATDERYLQRVAGWNVRNFRANREAGVWPDIVCRYEDLRADPTPTLIRIARAAKASVAPGRVASTAGAHDADEMLAGGVPRVGNLHPGGSPSWDELATPEQRALLHGELRPSVDGLEYPMDDCLGGPTPGEPLDDDVVVDLPPARSVGTLYVCHGHERWRRLGEARGTVKLPAGALVKLCATPFEVPSREVLARFPAGSLHALCLTHTLITLSDLVGLPLLGGLRELDLARTAVGAEDLPRLAARAAGARIGVVGTSISQADVAGLDPEVRERVAFAPQST